MVITMLMEPVKVVMEIVLLVLVEHLNVVLLAMIALICYKINVTTLVQLDIMKLKIQEFVPTVILDVLPVKMEPIITVNLVTGLTFSKDQVVLHVQNVP
jgi:hypothetical protein